jgi:hypothetical protein
VKPRTTTTTTTTDASHTDLCAVYLAVYISQPLKFRTRTAEKDEAQFVCPVHFVHNHKKRVKLTWLLTCCNAISYRSTNDMNTHIAAGRLPQALHALVARKPSWSRQGRARTPSRRMA